MNINYKKTEIDSPVVRAAIIAVINDAQHGGFIRVHNFKGKGNYGEIANTTYCKGINYANLLKNSIEILDEIEANPSFSIAVTRGVWVNDKDEISPTNRKNKKYPFAKTITKTYSKKDENLKPILLAAFKAIRKSLTDAKEPTKEYEKLGNGIYQDENGVLFLRDLRLARKDIVIKGDYPHIASSEEVAVANAIKRNMPISKYRMFRCDGDYTSISIGGVELAQDGLPEIEVKQEKEKVTSIAEPVTT
jgi:hypothetical protein